MDKQKKAAKVAKFLSDQNDWNWAGDKWEFRDVDGVPSIIIATCTATFEPRLSIQSVDEYLEVNAWVFPEIAERDGLCTGETV